MHPYNRKLRSALSSMLSLVIALPFVGGVLAVPHAEAAAPTQTLIISEINWAGSAGNSADQWVELYNPTSAAVDFGQHPYKLSEGATELASLTSGAVAPGSFYLVSRLEPSLPASHSTLNSMPGMKPDMIDPSLVVSRTALQLTLTDDTAAVSDVAGNGSAPLAGSDGQSGDMIIASMSRVSGMTDGTLPVSWFTPQTVGKSFTEASVQYGTPSYANVDVAAPTGLSVDQHPANALPTVSGTFAPLAGQTMPMYAHVVFTRVSDGQTFTSRSFVDAITGTFAASVALTPGDYRITVYGEDQTVEPNRSAAGIVAISGSPQNVYTVSSGTPVLSAPVLDPYPAAVNTPTVTLSGTVDSGSSAAFYVNGAYYGETPVALGSTAFSLSVTLKLNQSNTIEVRAKNASGSVSAPAVATVLQDNVAPAALNAAKVTVQSNPAGTADTVTGAAHAAEASAFVDFYSDAALTQKIATVQAGSNGSFAATSIGDNLYTTVYAVVRDAAGNVSPSVTLQNPIPFAEQQITLHITVSGITQNSAVVTWDSVSGAASYRVKYKMAGGSYSSPMTVPSPTQLSGLTAGTTYVVAIAAVDATGAESNYTEATFVTTSAPVLVSSTPIGLGSAGTSTPAPTAAVSTPASTPTPTPTVAPATPTPTPTATPDEQGQVKGDSTSRNWTPWIILAILIALAAIATAGYFYWFGGEDDDDDTTGTPGSGTPAVTQSTAASTGDQVTTKVTKKNNAQKRW